MSSSSLVRRVPQLRKHTASGRAYARFNGRCIYFGRHGTAKSIEAFERFKAEWLQHAGTLPSGPHETTVAALVVAYVEFAATYYVKDGRPTTELRMLKAALKIARQLYGRTDAAEFGPLALKACREAMIANDWCRGKPRAIIGMHFILQKALANRRGLQSQVCKAFSFVLKRLCLKCHFRRGAITPPLAESIMARRFAHRASLSRVGARIRALEVCGWKRRSDRQRRLPPRP